MEPSVLLARQPIFDLNMKTVAYELLYRSSDGAGPTLPFNGTQATAKVILHAYSNILQDGKIKTVPAFINFNADWLYNGNLPELDPDALVLEILEDVSLSEEILMRMKSLVDAGYRLALDDFIYDRSWEPALELAKIVKIDIQQLSPTQLIEHVEELKLRNITLLAEKIETHQEYQFCKSLGFKLFQGYFFCRPQLIEGCEHKANSMTLLNLINELENPKTDLDKIESIVSRDPELVIRLLKIVNSARFAPSREISNISEAIVAIGFNELKKWSLLISISRMNTTGNELISEVLTRAKACELASTKFGINPANAFLMGMLSGMDALLNLPLEDVINQLCLSEEISDALLKYEGKMGRLLEEVIHFMMGQWTEVGSTEECEIIAKAYRESIRWALETMRDIETSA